VYLGCRGGINSRVRPAARYSRIYSSSAEIWRVRISCSAKRSGLTLAFPCKQSERQSLPGALGRRIRLN